MNPKATKTISYRAGERISLNSLRSFTEITKDLDGDTQVSIREEYGQRDAVYYHLTVTETLDD